VPVEAPANVAEPVSAGATAEPPVAARSWSEARGIPYLYDGRWWSRGPSGEVVVWNGARQDWELALSAQTPFFMRRPAFTPLRTPATWATVLLAFFCLFSIMAFAADIEQAVVADDLRQGNFVSQNDRDNAKAIFEAMKGLQVAAVWGAAALFFWWLQRAVRNLRALGADGQKFGPKSAILWWFVPFVNLVQGARVMLEVAQASSANSFEPSSAWKSRAPDPVVMLWWFGAVIGWIGGSVIVQEINGLDASDPDRFGWSVAAAVFDVFVLGVAAMGMWVIWRITRRQERGDARFDVPAGASPPSASPAAQPI
jgi:hypothetical protein